MTGDFIIFVSILIWVIICTIDSIFTRRRIKKIEMKTYLMVHDLEGNLRIRLTRYLDRRLRKLEDKK